MNHFNVKCQSISMYFYVCLFVCLCALVCLSLSLCRYFVHLSLYLLIYLSKYPPLYLFAHIYRSAYVEASDQHRFYFCTYPPWYHRLAKLLSTFLYTCFCTYIINYIQCAFIYIYHLHDRKTDEENQKIRDLSSTCPRKAYSAELLACVRRYPWRLWNRESGPQSLVELILRNIEKVPTRTRF